MENIDNLNQHIGSNFNNVLSLTHQNSNDDIINKLKKNSNENNSNQDNFVTILQSFFGKSIIMDTALVFGLRMLLCFFRDICNDMNEIYCNSLCNVLQIKLSFPYPLALLFENFCNKQNASFSESFLTKITLVNSWIRLSNEKLKLNKSEDIFRK